MNSENPTGNNQDLFEIASEHASTQVPLARPTETIGELKQSIFGRSYECASHIVVCDEGAFLGVLRIEDLLAAADESVVSEVMDAGAPSVRPGLDQEMAAWHAVQHGEAALSVVDAQGKFVGIIPPDRLLAVLLHEHDEDMARLGGFLKNSTVAHLASEESIRRRFWHRIPWLLLGLAGAFAAADIVGYFEARLEENLVLAFFIPGIVYIADAVGTQTETVVVRGLSVGVSIGRVVKLELLSGLYIGLALALIATPLVLWRWGDQDVALTVGLSIFAACSTATIVAMVLPWILSRCNTDPAFGSGPLATVIQDLISIVLYFVIAAAVLS